MLFSQTLEAGRDSWDRGEAVVFSPATGERKVVVRGGSAARYLPSGHLLYSLGNTVLALPFDAVALEVRGGPVPVVEGVRRAANFSSGAVQLAVSDSGAMVFVPGEGVGDTNTLALVDRSGKVEPLDLAPTRHSHPRISPDQRRLALMTEEGSESVIWVADIAAGATPRRLTFDGRNRFPVWSPDSRDIACISDRSGRDALYRQAADGSGTAERLAEIPRLLTVDAWHPDGKSLLVMVSGDVWLVTPGSEPKPLVATSAPERHGAFSPEGKWFAYVRVVGTTPEVFVEPFPPTGVNKFQVSNGGGVSPVWSRDGKQLIFYAEARGAAEMPGRLLAVDVRTEPLFSFSSPRPVPTANAILGGIRQFDVSADGRILVRMPVAVERQRDQINVILNWIEDVKARVPTR